MKTFFSIIILFLLLFSCQLNAQNTIGGTPPSFTNEEIASEYVDMIDLIVPDMAIIEKEDKEAEKLGLAYRYGFSIPVDMGMDNAGTWSYLPDGSKIWRLEVRAEGAKAANFEFDQFWLPKNTRLYAYDKKQRRVLGAYTNDFNRRDGRFSLPLIGSDYLVLEYYQPVDVEETAIINISNFVYAYRSVESFEIQDKNTKTSDYCQVDVACSEANNWRDEEKGVCRVSIKNGGNSFWCTGSLVNNTAWDCKNYVLLADHCADYGGYASASDLIDWRFYFDYQAAVCNGTTPVPNKSVRGCSLISHNSISDFYLVEYTGTILGGYVPYYNGWIRSNTASPSGVGIHHPGGDIKKISTYNSNTLTTGWSYTGTHWAAKWISTTNGHGVTEQGSSGSPLFNNNGLLMGTLTGGMSACDPNGAGTGTGPNEYDRYGKFYYHWDKCSNYPNAQLKPHLDPGNTGVNSLPGTYCNAGINTKNTPDINLFVYPNPSKGAFTLEVPKIYDIKQRVEIAVYNLVGQEIWSNSFDNASNSTYQIDLSAQDAGVYYVNVAIGDKVATKKITIVR